MPSDYSCCLACYKTHNSILHQKNDRITSVQKTLRQEWSSNSKYLDILDKHLDIQCALCYHYCDSNTEKKQHESICLTRSITRSLYYGLPKCRKALIAELSREEKLRIESEILGKQLHKVFADTTRDSHPPPQIMAAKTAKEVEEEGR